MGDTDDQKKTCCQADDLAGASSKSSAPCARDPHVPSHSAEGLLDTRRIAWAARPDCLRDSVAEGLLVGAGIRERIAREDVVMLDIGFGLGTTALEAINAMAKDGNHKLQITALGLDGSVGDDFAATVSPALKSLVEKVLLYDQAAGEWGHIKVYWGDPRRNLFRIRGRAEVILLEPDSLHRCVLLHTYDFVRRLASLLRHDGILVTPAREMPLRNALHRCGLHVGHCHEKLIPGGGTLAGWDPRLVLTPLTWRERLKARRSLSGVPYRDCTLQWSTERILAHRCAVVERLARRGWVGRLSFRSDRNRQ